MRATVGSQLDPLTHAIVVSESKKGVASLFRVSRTGIVDSAVEDMAEGLKVAHEHFSCLTGTQPTDEDLVHCQMNAQVLGHVVRRHALVGYVSMHVYLALIDRVGAFGHGVSDGDGVSVDEKALA